MRECLLKHDDITGFFLLAGFVYGQANKHKKYDEKPAFAETKNSDFSMQICFYITRLYYKRFTFKSMHKKLNAN